jgi:hypothetical protein
MKFKKNESGMVFVEASVVFPIMFLVIFLMIYAGNAYYQKCRVEAIATELAIDGAAYCADPLLSSAEGGKIPELGSHNVYPYRAFDTDGVGTIKTDIQDQLTKKIEGLGTGLFTSMSPDVRLAKADYKNGFIYSTFTVDVEYKIMLPVRMLGSKDYFYLDFSTHISMPVSDTVELIRNVDMIEDYLEQLGVMEKVDAFTAKITEAVTKAKEWMN